MKDRKLDPVEKERKLADNANAPISKNNGQSSDSLSQKAQELLAF